MSDILITPAKLQGSVRAPASKSMCHRALICAGLATGVSELQGVTASDDIVATIEGMRALGATVDVRTEKIILSGIGGVSPVEALVDCGESGSTLRFLIPLALLSDRRVTFTGRGRLVQRPITEYANICQQQGLQWESDGGLPVTVQGRLKPGRFILRGDISSQFLSGMLFALPLLAADSSIRLSTPLESKGYVDLTLAVMDEFGVTAVQRDYQEFIIPGGQMYTPQAYTVEGDFSQAAFWLVAGTIGRKIHCLGLSERSLQGDKVIQTLIQQAGGNVTVAEGLVSANPAATCGATIDASDCPDLVPILAVLASLSQGETRIVRAGRLRLKESDRLAATARELTKLGAEIREEADSLIISGRDELDGGEVDSWQDHRIAMALAIASIRCKNPVLLHGAECVNKSYPQFWQDFVSLGGMVQ